MLKRIQPYFSQLYWWTLLWYHRGACVYWACMICLRGGQWPKELWPKKK